MLGCVAFQNPLALRRARPRSKAQSLPSPRMDGASLHLLAAAFGAPSANLRQRTDLFFCRLRD